MITVAEQKIIVVQATDMTIRVATTAVQGPVGPAGPAATNVQVLPALPLEPAVGDQCIADGIGYVALRHGLWRPVSGNYAWYQPIPGAPHGTGPGFSLTATGTATALGIATTNRVTMNPVLEALVTVASNTAVAGVRRSAWMFARGDIGGAGGFFISCRWRPATGQTIATHRAFAGAMGTIVAPTDVNPSTRPNIIGMGWDSGDANVQMMHNDDTGAATRIDLGAAFPRPTADRANLYDLEIYAPRGAAEVRYRCVNVVTDAIASGTISTDLPALTQLLTIQISASVGGTSSVIGVAAGAIYVATAI